MTCPTCAGYGHIRTIHGHAAPCPAANCRDGIVQSGPYSPECAVGCSTLNRGTSPMSDSPRDARTDELTRHRPVSEVDKLKRQLIEAWKERDEARAALGKVLEGFEGSMKAESKGSQPYDAAFLWALFGGDVRASLGQDKGASNG